MTQAESTPDESPPSSGVGPSESAPTAAADSPRPRNPEAEPGDEGLVITVDGVVIPDVLDQESVPSSSPEGRDSPPRSVPHWTGWLLLVLGLLTLPWIASIAALLPDKSEAANYNISWAGFDILLCLLLVRTGWALLHSRRYVEVTAAMTGALLIVDSWFDVMSAPDTGDFLVAAAMALLIQLPLAVFCLWVSARVEFERRQRSDLMAAVVRRLVRRQRRLRREPRVRP